MPSHDPVRTAVLIIHRDYSATCHWTPYRALELPQRARIQGVLRVRRTHARSVDVPRPESQTVGTKTDTELAVQAIRRIVRRLRLANQQVVRNAGVSAAQQFVLTVLAERSADSLQELARRTLADRTSVRDVLHPLLSHNLVERQPDPTDRRRTIIRITNQGRALLARAPEPPTAILVRGLQAMPSADLHTLAELLEQLVTRMGLTDDPASMLFHDQ